jgi:N-acetylgalactosamine kinase
MLTQRIDALVQAFADVYHRRPSIVAAAPGRVNLIGEHTDYNGLPVLPMAIDRTVLVAAAARDDRRVDLANVAPQFGPRRYRCEASIAPFAAGDWGNYHKAAAQGLLRMLGPSALNGGEFLVDGNVPAAAGLSSSSALIVSSALALLAVNECDIAPAALAQLMAESERYVGTMSGGMDQAICLLARPGSALRIDFDPLRTRPVPMPAETAIVVCDSLVVAEKSGSARAAYNQRVIECRLACRVLAHAMDLGERELPHLGALRHALSDRNVDDLVTALIAVVGPADCSARRIAEVLGMSIDVLENATGVALEAQTYRLVPRVRHVLREAERVDRAETALIDGDWRTLGALMNASHASCRDDYEVSCDPLESLVGAAKGAGVIGARLTGAGFGGCTVNLVPRDAVPRFLSLIDWEYYRPRGVVDGAQHCWVFAPSPGATVMHVS